MDRLYVEKIGKRQWRLAKDFSALDITVPEGFRTDGASVPRALWWMFDPAGELFEAAVVHDYMYSKAISNKATADECFYLVALLYGVKSWKAKLAYLTVKLLGRGQYGKRTLVP
jgi:hypothetical protein